MTLVSTAAKSSGAGGSMSVIRDTTLSVDTATLDVSSIAPSFVHMMLLVQLRTTVAAVGDFWTLRFNNDSGANYYYQYADANAAVLAAANGTAQTAGLGNCVGNSGPGSAFTTLQLWLPNYAGTTLKTYSGVSMESRNLAGGNTHQDMVGAVWNSTAAINRLTFGALTGPLLLAGSRVTVYGLAVS